jgi:hypothetical protein
MKTTSSSNNAHPVLNDKEYRMTEYTSASSFASVSPAMAKKLRLRLPFHKSARDEEIRWHLTQMAGNIQARKLGGGVKQCALVLMGDSNAGKTKLLEHHISQIPEFQDRIGADGQPYSPLLWTEAPGVSTFKSFAAVLLSSMGVQASIRAHETELYDLLKRVLKKNLIECVVVDESQHLIRSATPTTIKKVQNMIKGLLQIDDWPIHFIFAGTHELKHFLEGDRQLANRCRVMRLQPIKNKSGVAFIERLLNNIVIETGELEMGWTDEDKLPQRLMQASAGAMGTVIQTIQEACFRAIDDDRAAVTVADFASVYRLNSGCMKRDNIFLAANYADINPANAVDDLSA